MNDVLSLVPALGAGGIIGAIFFGGLWWTVRKGLTSKKPSLWFFGSLVVRTILALAGFYFVSGGEWKKLLACLLGFVIARVIVIRLPGPPIEQLESPVKKGDHEY
jgi:F1F0 ATPase subunit 2